MIIGENRVVERGGVLTARGTANSSEDPIGQAHPVVNALIFSEWSDGKHVEPELPIRPDNLLLDIGPRAECMIPPIMEERLPTLVSARSDLVHALNS